jgi:hypothetical protein
MAEQSERDLLITLVKDVAEVKTIVRDYKGLVDKVATLERRMAWYAGFAACAGVIVSQIIQGMVK